MRVLNSARSEPLKICAATTAMNVGANSPNMAGGLLPVGVSAAAHNKRHDRRYKEPYTRVHGGAFPPVLQESHVPSTPLCRGIPRTSTLAEPVPKKFANPTYLLRFS